MEGDKVNREPDYLATTIFASVQRAKMSILTEVDGECRMEKFKFESMPGKRMEYESKCKDSRISNPNRCEMDVQFHSFGRFVFSFISRTKKKMFFRRFYFFYGI